MVDGFAALQQATFANPKRKEIQAYADFRAAGGEVYVPTLEGKTTFQAAVEPVFEWFKVNAKGGPEVLDALNASFATAETSVASDRAAELNSDHRRQAGVACLHTLRMTPRAPIR